MSTIGYTPEGYEIKPKDTLAAVDYALELEDYLEAGVFLTQQTVTPDAGLTITGSAINNTQIVFRASAGIDGTDHKVRIDFTLSTGENDGRTVILRVKVL